MVRSKVAPKVEAKPTTKAPGKPAVHVMANTGANKAVLQSVVREHYMELKPMKKKPRHAFVNKIMLKTHGLSTRQAQVTRAFNIVQGGYKERTAKAQVPATTNGHIGPLKTLKLHAPKTVAAGGTAVEALREVQLNNIRKLVDALEHAPEPQWQELYERLDLAVVYACVADAGDIAVRKLRRSNGPFYTRQDEAAIEQEQVPAEATA